MGSCSATCPAPQIRAHGHGRRCKSCCPQRPMALSPTSTPSFRQLSSLPPTPWDPTQVRAPPDIPVPAARSHVCGGLGPCLPVNELTRGHLGQSDLIHSSVDTANACHGVLCPLSATKTLVVPGAPPVRWDTCSVSHSQLRSSYPVNAAGTAPLLLWLFSPWCVRAAASRVLGASAAMSPVTQPGSRDVLQGCVWRGDQTGDLAPSHQTPLPSCPRAHESLPWFQSQRPVCYARGLGCSRGHSWGC